MAVKKKKPPKTEPVEPPLDVLIKEVREAANVFRSDLARTIGVLDGASDDMDDDKNLNRLRAVAGRTRFTMNAGTRYFRAVSALKLYLDRRW